MPSLPAGFDPLVPLFGLAGLAWGVAAARIAARWPAHEDGSVRGLDWQLPVVAIFGAVAMAAVPERFGDPGQRLLFGSVFAACALLMATDLDQKLMPDVITLPLIVLGAVALAWGGDTLVSRAPWWLAVVGAIVIPGLLYIGSLPLGDGAFGEADVLFLAAIGLLVGIVRLFMAVFVCAIVAGAVVAALIALRRVTRRSYIPFGPFLIIGAVWAALLPAAS